MSGAVGGSKIRKICKRGAGRGGGGRGGRKGREGRWSKNGREKRGLFQVERGGELGNLGGYR